ncbi:hypothetical protein T09_5489 [Trichinella sp. T9]|nr:hypothetical protein T09_5489 [Trichinella sp. T9]
MSLFIAGHQQNCLAIDTIRSLPECVSCSFISTLDRNFIGKSFSCCDIQYQTSNSLAQLPTLSNGMQPFAVRLSLNRILRQEVCDQLIM